MEIYDLPIKIVLPWKIITTNRLYRSKMKNWDPIIYMIEAGRKKREQYIQAMKKQWNHSPIGKNLEILVELYRIWQQPDRDNFHKIVMDAWNGIIREDDILIKKSTVVKVSNSKNPRVELSIVSIFADSVLEEREENKNSKKKSNKVLQSKKKKIIYSYHK